MLDFRGLRACLPDQHEPFEPVGGLGFTPLRRQHSQIPGKFKCAQIFAGIFTGVFFGAFGGNCDQFIDGEFLFHAHHAP